MFLRGQTPSTPRIVVIGAGVGGLTAAALLARAGLSVTVLEAHVYAGGCAGTFFHRGYRFDAGATLAAGFGPGGPMSRLAALLELEWPGRPAGTALTVHLPGGRPVRLDTDPARWRVERLRAFGEEGEAFWTWQESAAGALWDLAAELPPWPPQTVREAVALLRMGAGWLSRGIPERACLLADALGTVAGRLGASPPALRLFADAQLLISAQCRAAEANALFGAAALDLPRRGVLEMRGGMGAVAGTLAGAVERFGGRILYRHQVSRILTDGGRPTGVETRRGRRFPAEIVVANLPLPNLAGLLGHSGGNPEPPPPRDGWGAFVLYAGVHEGVVPGGLPLHHQVVAREPLGEGNSIFLSLSPPWDAGRAPAGRRAVTISTHTALGPWWRLFRLDRSAYEERKRRYTDRVLEAAERVLPGFRDAVDLALPGTPVTFRRFTRREWGWVGGFPQDRPGRALGPSLGKGIWMVGDSVFPGQSTAAVAMGGMRVAEAVLDAAAGRRPERDP